MTESSDELKKQLDNIKAMMESLEATVAPLKAQYDEATKMEKAAYEEYQLKVAQARDIKRVLDEKMFESRSQLNKVQQEARRMEAKYNEAKKAEEAQRKAEELQAEFLVLSERWDKLTAGAPWREWAKDHQIKGAHEITANRKVILADPMGLGKTLTSIITCDMVEAATRYASPAQPFMGEEKQVYDYTTGDYVSKLVNAVEKPSGRKILYFCPSSMIKNVQAEFRMWAKHRNVLFIGGMTKAERDFALQMVLPQHPEYVVICNYEAWRRDKSLIDSLVEQEFDTIIIDEAHNVKNMKSAAYKGIKRLIDELNPPYVIPMTGTPILNRPQELFSLLTLVNPEKFYHENQFLYSYCEQDWNTGYWKFKPGGLDRISKQIRNNFLRRTRDQAGIVLPEKTITIHALEVDEAAYPNQAKVRKEMKQYATILIDDTKAIAAAAMIAVFTRLRQIETWPAGIEVKDENGVVKLKLDVEESQKLDYIIHYDQESKHYEGLIPDVVEDERIVLFSQFKAPLRELKDRIERMGKRAVILDGDTPESVKEEIRIDFDARHTPNREESKWDVVLCNYRVGGVGLNLTAATQMIILDEEWNPGKRDQAYDRIHRMGQEKPVTIHVIRNQNTIDDWLANIMEAKEELVLGFNTTMVKEAFKEFLDKGGLA